jgi:hypothetical protein
MSMMMRTRSRAVGSDLRRIAGSDAGSAMLIVMACLVILFVVSTMLITSAEFQVIQSAREVLRVRAMNTADAGLNAYLAGLRHDGPGFAFNYPSLGPVATSDGTWTASIVETQGAFLVTAAGSVNDGSGTYFSRTVVSRVSYPSYADYALMGDCDINIGADATFIGKVGATGSITNAGKVYADSSMTQAGALWAGGAISDQSGSKPRRTVTAEAPMIHENLGSKWIDFGQISGDMTNLQSAATSSSTNFANLTGSNVIGYRVTLNGALYSLHSVKGNKFTGGLTYTAISGRQNLPIPAGGVLFFDDDVWVVGSYNAALTIASSGDVMLTQNILATNSGSIYTCGLVAQNNVWIPIAYSTSELPDTLKIQAATMAITGQNGVYFDAGGPLRSKAWFVGSRTYAIATGLVSGSGSHAMGFGTRVYDYDQRLNIYTPPNFPVIRNGTLKVMTWQER